MWRRAIVLHDLQPRLAPCCRNKAEVGWHALEQSTGVCYHHKVKERFGEVCGLYANMRPLCTFGSVATCSLTLNIKLHLTSAHVHAMQIATWPLPCSAQVDLRCEQWGMHR